MGKNQAAEKAYRIAIESRHPEFAPWAGLDLAISLDDQGSTQSALAVYRETIEHLLNGADSA